MRKKTVRVMLVISVLIIAFLGELQTVFVEADPFVVLPPPVIRIGSADGVIYSENTVTIPYWVEVYPMGIEISNFSCSFDGKLLETTVPISPKSLILTGLSDGNHTISVTLFAKTTLTSNSHLGVYWTTKEVSESVTFTVDTTAPTITIISPKNTTYNPTGIPLNFTVDEPTSWVGYSINNQANITLTENTTLRVQAFNLLVIYANDSAGNMGKSEAVFFEVGPSPGLTTPPSPSPTIEPTPEPTQTATPTNGDNQTVDLTPIILAAVVAVAVAVAALVYLKRRKG